MDKKVVVAGLVSGVVYYIVTLLFGVAGRPFMEIVVFKHWGFLFYFLKLVFDLVVGLFFVGLFSYVHKSMPGKNWNRGFTFGFIIYLIADIGMLSFVFLTFSFPEFLLLIWAVGGLLARLLQGFVAATMIK